MEVDVWDGYDGEQFEVEESVVEAGVPDSLMVDPDNHFRKLKIFLREQFSCVSRKDLLRNLSLHEYYCANVAIDSTVIDTPLTQWMLAQTTNKQ